MEIRSILIALLLLGGVTPGHASIGAPQLAQIHKSLEGFVRDQTAGLPGKVSFTLGAIDTRLNLPSCPAPQAFLPSGTRLWGNATVGVRCGGNTPWTIYVPVTVTILAEIVVAAHTLAYGRVIEAGDLVMQEADLGRLSSAVVTDPGQAVGRIATVSLAGGQALRQDLLRAPPVIRQGQSVTLRSQGSGFKVSAEGKAVTQAAEGQVAQVRTPSGRTVSGIARFGGIVDIP